MLPSFCFRSQRLVSTRSVLPFIFLLKPKGQKGFRIGVTGSSGTRSDACGTAGSRRCVARAGPGNPAREPSPGTRPGPPVAADRPRAAGAASTHPLRCREREGCACRVLNPAHAALALGADGAGGPLAPVRAAGGRTAPGKRSAPAEAELRLVVFSSCLSRALLLPSIHINLRKEKKKVLPGLSSV